MQTKMKFEENQAKKLLNDIKQALTDKEHHYYVDKQNLRVIVLAKYAQMLEYGNFQACQSVQVERNPDNFVAIDPISEIDEYEWMNEFAALPGHNFLLPCLSGENPFEDFFAQLSDSVLNEKYKQFMDEQLSFLATSVYKNAFELNNLQK